MSLLSPPRLPLVLAALGLCLGGAALLGERHASLAVGSPFPEPPRAMEMDAPPPPGAAAAAMPVELPSDPALPRAADGRHYPLVPRRPEEIATLLTAVEAALRDEATPAAALPALGHQQQVIYRVLSHRDDLAAAVLERLEPRWRRVAERHLVARRAFLGMRRGRPGPATLPAWRIIEPEPAENLLRYYREAEAATGIEWEVLAAVNLVETGMGRIDGVSVADARGPMQFLPTTWAQPGVGKGDIRDPHDAIQAAARYLVRRGGLADIRKGLWGYNNSDYYGRAVLAYADLMREDPRAFTGLYHWEIHFASAAGDLWLPVGYAQDRPVPVAAWLKRHPASAPPVALPIAASPAETEAALR